MGTQEFPMTPDPALPQLTHESAAIYALPLPPNQPPSWAVATCSQGTFVGPWSQQNQTHLSSPTVGHGVVHGGGGQQSAPRDAKACISDCICAAQISTSPKVRVCLD